jgi:hypothetical protein
MAASLLHGPVCCLGRRNGSSGLGGDGGAAQVREVRGPAEAEEMAGRHAKPHRNRADDDVAGAPKGSHGRDVSAEVGHILAETLRHPVDRVGAAALNKLFHGIKDRKVDAREENADIEGDLLECCLEAGQILHLFCQAGVCKPVHPGKPLSILSHEDPPLKSAEVRSTKYDKNTIAFPVDLHGSRI